MLQCYPNKRLVQFMAHGIFNGFLIGFTNAPSSLKAVICNLEGEQEHPEVVSDYLLAEISLGRIAGLFPPQAVPQVHASRSQRPNWQMEAYCTSISSQRP